jgi:hypothetical protein
MIRVGRATNRIKSGEKIFIGQHSESSETEQPLEPAEGLPPATATRKPYKEGDDENFVVGRNAQLLCAQ